MPKPALKRDWREYQRESSRLQALIASVGSLEPKHRKLVAEIVMIRLFLLTENTIASVCVKILCGAVYLDGTSPQILVTANSMSHAEGLMKSHKRPKAKAHLKWTTSKEIRDNLRLTLDAKDPLFHSVSANGSQLTEMRFVRNHIAHRSQSTSVHFRDIIKHYYGGLKQGMTPGMLLLTPALGPPLLMERYVTYGRVLIKDLVRA